MIVLLFIFSFDNYIIFSLFFLANNYLPKINNVLYSMYCRFVAKVSVERKGGKYVPTHNNVEFVDRDYTISPSLARTMG